jgi:hypothetical protein
MVGYGGLIEELVKEIPEARLPYEREKRWWGKEDPGPHNIYGNVLVPMIKAALKAGGHSELLGRIFSFLERLASSEREEIRDVVTQSVLEPLADDEEDLAGMRPYLGPRALEAVRSIGEFWGIDHARDLE